MRSSAIVLSLCAVLTAAVFAGCGSSDSDSSSTSSAAATATATVPAGKVSASTAPPKLGFYAGVDCSSLSSSKCDGLYAQSKEGYFSYCKGGHDSHYPSDFKFEGKYYNFVCFQLKSANNLVNFYYADPIIVRSVHVSSDRFPETCDNGYCIQGEWFSTRTMSGKIRNPNSVYSPYHAEWIGS